ncbi:DUF6194 family protein [Herbiconiux sp. L3-i23]|uniref:DUF6194 family protein n=1 Tax=Herbiconiux sp. L3-i23 TaxID=2905871 RepID=UPI0020676D21|nr:DUF6194 family protein [Herbiconiux sp. L3-i23]BDI22041.1 hypothetical protein L3i23_08170 [Herbiconiux sp. L3-i23]
MEIAEILDTVRSCDGALVLAPTEGDDAPEIAWGDYFFYFAPDGVVPTATQPYATIVTKDYPDDTASRLGEGRWRVNIHVGQRALGELVDVDPADEAPRNFAATDEFLPHPVYGALGWVSVVAPGPVTGRTVLALLKSAHADERARVERRSQTSSPSGGRPQA